LKRRENALGKFIEEQAVIQTHLDNYIKQAYDFSKYIEGSPTFVTYYSKDILASTEDVTLGGVLEHIGTESPIKFNKIENFPVYGIESLVPQTDYDEEEGLSTEIEGQAVILPNTIKPLVNDYFRVSLSGNLLYRVTNVEVDNAGNKVMYRISYSLSSSSPSILEEKQISENFKVVYENIGKDVKSVIKESDFLLLDDIDSEYNNLVKKYTRLFYNKDYNTFLFNDRIYDKLLIKFISDNNLFIKTRTFLKNIKIEPSLKEDMDDFFIYEGTIFNALENMDKDLLENFVFNSEKVNEPSSVFSLFKNKYEIWKLIYNELGETDSFGIYPDNFIDNIKSNVKFIESEYQLFNFLIDYLNNSLVKENLINYVAKEKFKSSLINYTMIPCILFILKQIQNTIMNK
jgi:hypothetical protein